MAQFIFRLKDQAGIEHQLKYDNHNSTLQHMDGTGVVEVHPAHFDSSTPVVINKPGKKISLRVLKISLGLSCNYECNYCSQRFVPNSTPTNPENIDAFLQMLQTASVAPPERIEFWGGEPLVYWKTLKPLAEKLRSLYPKARFAMVTNGSLLDKEKNEWLESLDFTIGLSHDGPGYHARGVDPLDDISKREAIADLYSRLHPKGKITINAMMHRDNLSRASVQLWHQQRFGPDVVIGEGTFIDPYDEGGMSATLQNQQEQVNFRKSAFFEMRTNKANNFIAVNRKINSFIDSIKQARPASALGQKCQMDRTDHVAVDLLGNVLTCQNVSAKAIAPNGQIHKSGNLNELSQVNMLTSTHWSERKECPNCPVLQLCAGSCMFLEGALWKAGCEAAYSDNVAFLASALYKLTGMTLFRIESETLPEHRRALWITTATKGANKIIPILRME